MRDFIRRPRRETMGLQLTAMIDIFSLIVIFLVIGANHESTDIVFPNGFVLPKSKSKESTESTNEVFVSLESVNFKKLNLELGVSEFSEEDSESASLKKFEDELKKYAQGVLEKNAEEKLSLNVIADERLSYEKLYAVLKVFRKAGFKNLYFVASPKEAKS